MTRDWADYRQDREIRALGSELSSIQHRQRNETSQLRSQLANLQGSVEERLRKLSRAFDAFVELSDVRATLALFDAPARVRLRLRQLLAETYTGVPVPPADQRDTTGDVLPAGRDVPGYWLSPATRALGLILNGDNAGAQADIAAAQQLEPEKIALLLAATAALAERQEIAVVWLSTALGQFVPGVPLTAAKRLLWREAVDGSFGPAGLAEIETRLRACHPENAELYVALKVEPESNGPFEASRKLIALRALCEAPTAPVTPSGLGDLVRQLVDEGIDDEKPFLRRAEELRAIIEDRPVDGSSRYDAVAGTPEMLLIEDAASTINGGVGAFARRVLAEPITAVAASLSRAALVDPPTETTVELRSGTIRVTPAGPDATDVKKASAKAELGYPPITVVDAWSMVFAVGGIALTVLGLFVPTGLAVLFFVVGAALLIAGVMRVVGRGGQQAAQTDLRSRAGRDVQRRAEQGWRELLSNADTLRTVSEAAAVDRKAIEDILTGR